jgi:CHASE2 domain-containing sensor protein
MAITESQARRRQILAGGAIGLLCWGALAATHLSGWHGPFDLRLLDLKYKLRGERPAWESIAIVGIDDETIRGYGGWPLSRDSYALLLAALEEAGAKAIGVDLQFPTDRNQQPAWNELLAHVSGAHENIVHAAWFHAQESPNGVGAKSQGVPEALARHGTAPADLGIAVAAAAAVPFDELLESTPRLGHVSVAVDGDGAIRRVPLFVAYQDRSYPALAVVLYGLGSGFSTTPALDRTGGTTRVRWAGGAEIPFQLDAWGSTSIDFAGDRRSFPNTHSMLGVLQSYRAGDLPALRAAFEGRTVLVGLTSRKEASEDVGATPFALATPLLYVHANLLDNLARGRFLARPSTGNYLAGTAILTALMGILLSSIAILLGAVATVVAVLLLAGAVQAAFAWGGMDVPGVMTLASVPLTYAVTGGYRYLFLEQRSRVREAEIREGLSVQQQFLPEAMIGRMLSRYRIDARLGAGGMGVVYQATDLDAYQEVALKVLPAAGLADEKLRRRFRREAAALSRLNHPNIARLIEFDSQNGVDFIAMELVRGMSLLERLKRGPIPEAEAIGVATQICDALTEAHGRGILHRDMKPGNVMMSEAGEVKLLDFGLARLTNVGSSLTTGSGSLTETGQVVGTLAYMAPEILHGERADERTDVYGVGMLLYEMFTGRRPFPDDSPHELMYMIVNQPPPKPSVLNGRINSRNESLVLDCLAKDRAARPASVAAVRERL